MPQHPLYAGSLARMSFRVPVDESITALLDEIAETPEWVGASNAGVLSLLYTLVISCGLRNVLQLGTYVGYSSLVLGDAARRIGGSLITLDPDERAMGIARGYLTRAGLDTHVRTVLKASTDPAAIAELQPEAPFDLVYIDSLHDYACAREELPAYWPMLRPAGFLCMDDADEAAAGFDTRAEGGVLRAIKEWLPTVRDCEWIMMRQPSWDPVGCLLATKVPSGKELMPRSRGLMPTWLKRSLSRANGQSRR